MQARSRTDHHRWNRPNHRCLFLVSLYRSSQSSSSPPRKSFMITAISITTIMSMFMLDAVSYIEKLRICFLIWCKFFWYEFSAKYTVGDSDTYFALMEHASVYAWCSVVYWEIENLSFDLVQFFWYEFSAKYTFGDTYFALWNMQVFMLGAAGSMMIREIGSRGIGSNRALHRISYWSKY